MDDIQKTNQPTESGAQPPASPQVTPPNAPQTPSAFNATPPANSSTEPRNFFATFLLASYGGILGLRHFYLGQKTLGFVRLGLILGYFALFILGSVAQSGVLIALGGLAFMVAYIWAIVDFFVVYLSVKTDADGQPLTKTNRDAKWAKVMFIVTVSIAAIGFIAGVVLAMTGEKILKNIIDSSSESGSSLQIETDPGFNTYDFNSGSSSIYDYQTR